MGELTLTQKIGGFFTENKSRLIKGALLVTVVVAGVLATKYAKTTVVNKYLEYTADVPQDFVDNLGVVEDVVKEQL